MARKSRTAVLKRQREVRKAEKAAEKREKRVIRSEAEHETERVATAEDLEGYGFAGDEADKSETPPPAALFRVSAALFWVSAALFRVSGGTPRGRG